MSRAESSFADYFIKRSARAMSFTHVFGAETADEELFATVVDYVAPEGLSEAGDKLRNVALAAFGNHDLQSLVVGLAEYLTALAAQEDNQKDVCSSFNVVCSLSARIKASMETKNKMATIVSGAVEAAGKNVNRKHLHL